MNASGVLNPESKERANLGLEIESRVVSENIITTGWSYRPDSPLSIAEAFWRYMTLKSPELNRKILLQRHSRDTVGDAFFTRLLVEKKKIPKDQVIYLITSDYHCKRAKEIFEFVFPPSYTIYTSGSFTSNVNPSVEKKEKDSLHAFRRSFLGIKPSDIKGIYGVLRSCHPFYNGDTFAQLDSLEEIMMKL